MISPTIPTITQEDISEIGYPSAGTGDLTGWTLASAVEITKTVMLNLSSSSSSTGDAEFLRINSFSACKAANNTGLIAIASQDAGLLSLDTTTDTEELARRMASRVYVISTPLGTRYAGAVRNARVTAIDQIALTDCTQDVIDILVDADSDFCADTNLDRLYILDGDLSSYKFRVVERSGCTWKIIPDGQEVNVPISVNTCFNFVAYSSTVTQTYPNSLNFISPLPYIQVDGLAVPAVNPQIASNEYAAPDQPIYGYVIAEAPVNGSYQLFFYSFKIATDYEIFGWRQLTYDGDNRNAKINMDKYGNLHVTWESGRCQPTQVMYGVIGPHSRALMNEAFVTAVDKQSATHTFPTDLETKMVTVTAPTSVEMRSLDEYGVPIGEVWTEFELNGGAVTIVGDQAVTVVGNPKTQKFAAFVCLDRDETDTLFDGQFSQLSYQVSFDLTLSALAAGGGALPTVAANVIGEIDLDAISDAIRNNLDPSAMRDDLALRSIYEEFVLFKQSFTPTVAGATNINVFEYAGDYYTIDNPKIVYENIIPLAGSYKADGLCGNPSYANDKQLSLRHFLLVACPEKVRFIAKSTGGGSDVYEDYYTGRFKLGLVFETSAGISEQKTAYQKHHWLRLFGKPLYLNQSYDYKVAVHYSHLRDESVTQRVATETLGDSSQDARFSGDIVVTVDDEAQCGETFVADFSDQYRQFDIGLGCSTTGEFRTLTLNPYDGSTNDNLITTLTFTNVVVGPHSVFANNYLTLFAKTDRNVSRMVVLSDANELESMTTADEAWGTEAEYLLSLGLRYEKFELSQMPITFKGKNCYPDITTDLCGHAHIAFQSNRDKNWQVYYTSSDDPSAPFRFDTRITNTLGNSLYPTVAVDQSGRKLIAWQDNRDGNYQIYAARKTTLSECSSCEKSIIENLGTTPVSGGFATDEYVDAPYFGNLTELRFEFTNDSETQKNYHFRANFFTDAAFTAFYTDVDSRQNIANWIVTGTTYVSGGLIGQYYNRSDLTDLVLTRIDATVDFDWGSGPPDPLVDADTFSIRWTGKVEAIYTETYTFYTNSDDGVRLYVNGTLLVDKWIDQSPTEWSGTVSLVAGQKYDIVLEYYENGVNAEVELSWSSASQSKEIIPTDYLYYQVQNQSSWEQLPHNGVLVDVGETVSVTYMVSKEDDLNGSLYYVEIEADDGTSIEPLEKTILYYAPQSQRPKCVVPIVYTNNTAGTQSAHFRITVYRDDTMLEAVLTASTSDSVIRFVSGAESFPASGISVLPGETVSVVYNPEILSLELQESRDNSVITSLLCNTTYWITVESNISSVYTEIDSFSLRCNCDDIKTHIWRTDTQSVGWECSGQGGMDSRLTLTASHALSPAATASKDGIVYISWQDRRFNDQTTNYHYAYFCIWDARTDIFYSSGQGYNDKEIYTHNRFRPIPIVNNMQHATFLFSDGEKMYTRTCSLYRTPAAASSSSATGEQGVFNEEELPLTTADAAKCLTLRVAEEDIIRHYHETGTTPIALVNKCKIAMEIVGQLPITSVRFKNEDESTWSDWIDILPSLPEYPSSSSTDGIYNLRTYLLGYYAGKDRAIVQWILSRGSGNKTVSCQVLTPSGVTPVFTVNIVARYKETKYKIEFFRDNTFLIPASMYNGTPVISSNVLTVDSEDTTSLSTMPEALSTIFIKVTFDDPDYLDNLLDMNNIDKYSDSSDLTFNVYTQGFNDVSLPLTRVSSGVYTGSFVIAKHDGVDNKDGEAVITISVPTPQETQSSSSSSCDLVTPDDISLLRAQTVASQDIALERFWLRYDKEYGCNFTSLACADGTETYTESDDDTSASEPPPYEGAVSCDTVSWVSPRLGEPDFFIAGAGQNATNWIAESPAFELDFSDDRIDYLKFAATCELDDILILVREDETIGVTESVSEITFAVPQGSIIFAATSGYYCHGPAACNNGGSDKKVFKVSTTTIATVPLGTSGNDGTGNISLFSTIPSALGYNDGGVSSSSSSAHYTNCLKTTFAIGVSKSELDLRGFVTGDGTLRFKLIHIISGVGHATINVTCGASCFD